MPSLELQAESSRSWRAPAAPGPLRPPAAAAIVTCAARSSSSSTPIELSKVGPRDSASARRGRDAREAGERRAAMPASARRVHDAGRCAAPCAESGLRNGEQTIWKTRLRVRVARGRPRRRRRCGRRRRGARSCDGRRRRPSRASREQLDQRANDALNAAQCSRSTRAAQPLAEPRRDAAPSARRTDRLVPRLEVVDRRAA